ncbi:MAG: hypothetical protein A2Z72_07875 [Omnitrophica bacterium RBG_13_46_9]|nr:MAG: hypothetical protein A2Z72_07875 [Omnitrophica bacterium RBG_13_46_9]
MNLISIITACLLSLIVSIFGVSVGGSSLITIPLLIWLGMTSKNAVATNMFALIFLSASGVIGFRRQKEPAYYKIIAVFSALTICGSFIGAHLILAINKEMLKTIIAIMVCVVGCFLLFKKDLGVREEKGGISKAKLLVGALLTFILGIYGGFFSAGYVTLLSYVLIFTLGLNFLQAAFITKIFNTFSSFAACIFFYYHGLIDFSIGIPLAVFMSLGALLGAKLAVSKGNLWVRNLFIVSAIVLAVKLLLF